ncbi:MAG: hypothetical protein ACYTEZ_18805 [Planctomycetota bacterium]|jgi:predicted esterase
MRQVGLLGVLLGAALAAEPEPAPVPLKQVPADGRPHHVRCKAGTYWIAIPEAIDARQPTRAFLWCHGSNMHGKWYLQGLQAFGYGPREILIGPNGHKKSKDWVYNFDAPTYDTRLAYAILDEVARRFKLGPVYVGGHSQGAYYTYRIVLSKPERFAGAIPFAGGLLLGLDPKSAAHRKGRPGPPFAILHGEQDRTVDPSLSDWAYEVFRKAGYPSVRYFHPAKLNHWWPGQAKEAIAWVLAITAEDPAALLQSAEGFLEADRGSDALHCVDRAKRRKGDAGRIGALRERILARGEEHAAAWLERMHDRAGEWAREMYEFRDAWGRVPTVAPVMKRLLLLRKKHVPQAAKQNRKAWKHANKGETEKARPWFQKTVDECFTAFEYVRPARRWLAKN